MSFPAYFEEWVDVVVGLIVGFNSLLQYEDKSCIRSMTHFAMSLYGVHKAFDSAFPTQIVQILLLLLNYVSVTVAGSSAFSSCKQEYEYETLLI